MLRYSAERYFGTDKPTVLAEQFAAAETAVDACASPRWPRGPGEPQVGGPRGPPGPRPGGRGVPSRAGVPAAGGPLSLLSIC